VHGLAEYALGALAVAAPFVLGFDSGAAGALGVVLGAAVLVLGFLSEAPTGIMRRVPIDSHHVLDYVIGVAAIAGPFVLGFSDEAGATAFFIAFGAAFLVLAFATRYKPQSGRR
jgi:hypothetical protein